MKAVRSYYENRMFRKVFYRCQKNDDCEIHFQRDIEIIHVVSGCLDMTVRDEKRLLVAGDIMVASSYESHGFKTIGSSEFRVFIIPAEIVPEYIACTANKMLTTNFFKKSERTEKLLWLLDMLVPYANTEITLAGIGYIYAILGTLTEEIGLIPSALSDRVQVIGNAALTGAAMLLLDRNLRNTATMLAKQATTADLASSPVFSELFMNGMMFE